jgi:hypothetical protein
MTSLSCLSSVKRSAEEHSRGNPSWGLFTDIEVIVDKSGSMCTMNSAPPEQIHKTFMDQQKLAQDNPNQKIHMSLTCFDHDANTVIDNIDIRTFDIPDANEFTNMLKPSGSTRCYDTVIERIRAQDQRIKEAISKLPYAIRALNPTVTRILYLLTDGEDNQSGTTVRHFQHFMHEQKTTHNLKSIFLAANIGDAQIVGTQMGFDSNTCLTIGNNYHLSSNGMASAGHVLRQFSQNMPAPAFTALQRASSQAPHPVSSTQDDTDDEFDNNTFANLSTLPLPMLRRA